MFTTNGLTLVCACPILCFAWSLITPIMISETASFCSLFFITCSSCSLREQQSLSPKKLICIFSRPLLILPFTAPWVGFGCSILNIVYSIKKLYCIHNVYSFSNCQLRVSWNFGGYLVLFCAGVCSWNLWTISLQHRGHNHIAYVIILPDSPTS